MGHQHFRPDINPRAYTSPVLVARLDLLLKDRAAHYASASPARYAETLAIATELVSRGVALATARKALALPPETRERAVPREARRTKAGPLPKPEVDYIHRHAA